MFGNFKNLLERIADALERIADALEQRREVATTSDISKDDILTEFDNEIDLLEDIVEDIEDVHSNDEFPYENNETDPIEDFLNNRGITIKTVPPEDPADNVINSLSLFLGEHYDGLKRILAKIKRHMQKGSFFTENIKNNPQQTISDITQFCTRLHNIAFLEQYKYFKSPQYFIKAKATTLPMAQKFFSGQWLERFVLQKVGETVTNVAGEMDEDLGFSYLLNPQIVLPNGDDFELDLIFHANNNFFWVEAKSGDYRQHIAKYSKISNLLGLDYRHSIMVLTDITPDQSSALSSLFGMMVYSLNQLEEGLIETLRRDVE